MIACTDLHSHFAWVWATRSHASAAAAQFFRLIQAVFPFAIEAVLTDNVLNASCTSLRSNSHPGRRGDPRRLGETASTTTNQWSSAVVQGSLA